MKRRAADASGVAGDAWLVAKAARVGECPPVSRWLVSCPGVHPYWHWWVVQVLDVRKEIAARLYAKAEYGIIVYAVDPYSCPEPDVDAPENGYPDLIPWDIVENFHGISEAEAAHLCATAVRAIVSGLLVPDEDQAAQWKKSVAVMVETMRSGAHVR
jgi:hypothetical protein